MTVLASRTLVLPGVSGSVFEPGDPGYVQLVTPWNVAVPSAPAAVVQAADAADVVAAVRFARAQGLRVDVRATGHGAAPLGADTLLVHTGRLDELTVYPEGWARVGAGVCWSRVVEAAAPHGLAPLCGSAPGVGVVGYLTGGGLGPIARTFGFASDYVRAFEVVTGDGVLRRASAAQNPELFWALSGGKGAAGVVTAVEFDLVPVTEVYAGAVYFSGDDAAAVLHAWSRWCPSLPEQATTSAALVRLPDLPGVPAPLAGTCALAVRFAWVGDLADGAEAAAPVAGWARPLLGGFGPMPYTAVGGIHADPVDPMPVTESAQLLRELPADAVDALLAVAGPDTDCPQVVVELRLLGGALRRRPAQPSALCHRDAAFSLLSIGLAVPAVLPTTLASAERIAAAVGPWTMEGGLPNFGGAATPTSVTRAYTKDVLVRLGAVVRGYDPGEVLACADPVRQVTAG